ncbi:hypothetical protein EDF68_11441 [Ochrobactrum sp. BH3]|nr:hypothetical protein EDF68_11441 [Ochrobactrum sp. BH3]
MKRYFSHFTLFDLLYLVACVIGIVVFYPSLWAMVGIAALILLEIILKLFFFQPADHS